jgi:hypothetical protein
MVLNYVDEAGVAAVPTDVGVRNALIVAMIAQVDPGCEAALSGQAGMTEQRSMRWS